MVNAMSRTLKQSGVPHRGGTHGKPRHFKDVISAQVGSLPKGQGLVPQKVIPCSVIDARDLVTADTGRGKTLLGKRSLSDDKILTKEGAAVAPTSQRPLNKELQSTDANSAGRTTK